MNSEAQRRPAARRWTSAEDAELVRVHVDNPWPTRGRVESLASLAERFGRTPTAVTQRARKLGLRRYNRPAR